MKQSFYQRILLSGILFFLAIPAWSQPPAGQEPSSVMRLDTITVSATRQKEQVGNSPASVVVVSQEDIMRSQATTLKDALDDIVNVDFDNAAMASIQRPSIRGLDHNQILIKIDGVRQTFRGTGGIARNPAQIDPLLLKKVEVLRGPASSLHGSGGMGGVITMRTKDASDFLAPGQTKGGMTRAGFKSATEEYSGMLAAYAKIQTFDLLAAGTYRDLGDYHSSSPQPGSHTTSRDGYDGSGLLKFSVQSTPEHKLAFFLNTYNDKMEYPNSKYDSSQQRVGMSWDWITDNGFVDLKAALQYIKRKDTMQNEYRDLADDFNSIGLDMQNTFSGKTGSMDWNLILGMDASLDHQKGTEMGLPDPSRPDAEAKDLGMFSQLSLTAFDQFTLTPALRYTHYERTPRASEAKTQKDNHFSPQITAQWTPKNWLNIFAKYAETYRAPSMDEIYFEMEFPALPPRPAIRVVPNPDLKPETAKTFEAGFGLAFDQIWASMDQFRFKAVYFNENVRDFIAPSTTPVITPGAMEFTTINAGKVHRYGVEIEAAYHFHPFFIDLAYGMVHGRDEDTDAKTGSVPQSLTLTLGMDIQAANLNLYWKSKFVEDSDYVLYTMDRDHVPGYAVHGVGLVWTPEVSWAKNLRFDLAVNNVLDKEYTNYRGGTDKGLDLQLACTFAF